MMSMRQPKDVSDVELVFGGDMKKLMPSDIPAEFRDGRTPQNDFVSRWFFKGVPGLPAAKPDVDRQKALRHIKAIMVSFEPKHEDKEAACAYLLSEWFETPEDAPCKP